MGMTVQKSKSTWIPKRQRQRQRQRQKQQLLSGHPTMRIWCNCLCSLFLIFNFDKSLQGSFVRGWCWCWWVVCVYLKTETVTKHKIIDLHINRVIFDSVLWPLTNNIPFEIWYMETKIPVCCEDGHFGSTVDVSVQYYFLSGFFSCHC